MEEKLPEDKTAGVTNVVLQIYVTTFCVHEEDQLLVLMMKQLTVRDLNPYLEYVRTYIMQRQCVQNFVIWLMGLGQNGALGQRVKLHVTTAQCHVREHVQIQNQHTAV